MESVGQIVRRRRQQRGLTLRALAESVGAATSYLSMIENDRVAGPPSAALVERLEQQLGVLDGSLRAAADWASTPEPVRRQVAHLADAAQEGRKLAAWLKASAGRSQSHGGRDLDALYRSGQLGKRVNRVLSVAESGRDGGTPPKAHGVEPAVLKLATRVPLINRVAAGEPSMFTDLGYPAGGADEYLTVPDLDDPDAFATRVTGKSMEPGYREGDIVVFSPLAGVSSGCDAFVRLEPDHEITFKRVYFEGEGAEARIRLQPLNPDFSSRVVPRESVAGLFRAVWRIVRV